ncbi:hypothetical protein RB595_006202 [Gaeumannomyces hyphopodioides]
MCQWLYVSAVLYCPAAYLTKVTLLLLMARVFAVKEHIARGIYLFIVLITVLYTPVQVVKTILCVPIRAFWDGGVQADFCFDSRKVFVTDIALALCTDAVILVLPVFLAWPLHLSTRKKLKIAALLGAGGGAIGTDALRISKVIELQYEVDTSGRFTLLTTLTTLELATGFVCACVPPINLLLERHIRRASFSGNTPRTPMPPRRRARITAAPLTLTDRPDAAPTPPKRLSNPGSSLPTLPTTTTATATTATMIRVSARTKPSTAASDTGTSSSGTPASTRWGRETAASASERGISSTRMPEPDGRGRDAEVEAAAAAGPNGDAFSVDVERALITGRPLTRAAAAGEGHPGDAAEGSDRARRPRDWLRRVASSQPWATAGRSTDGGSGDHVPYTEPAAGRQQQQPEITASSGATWDLGGITKTVEISLERSSAPPSSSTRQEPPPLPPPPDAVVNTQAAYDGRRRLIAGAIWDGRAVSDEEEGDASL